MASSNEKKEQKPEVRQEPVQEQLIVAPPKNKSFMATGALLLALGASATAGYTLWSNQQLQSQLADKNNQFSAQIAQLTEKQAKAQEQIGEKANHVAEASAALQNKFEDLNKQLQTAMSQRFYQNQNWLLLKARYYLELAQINAHWSKSFKSSIALLQQADQLLTQLNDPQILEIRQAVAKDIAQLQAVPVIDMAGILSQLDAAQNSLNALSVSSAFSNNKPLIAETPAEKKETPSIWRLRLQDSMNVLSKLVVVRHQDEHIQPLVSPMFEALLKENIRLNLQEAQWAVLNSNPEVYKLVLNQAINLLKKNFNESASNTAALIKTLTELQQIQLIQKRPEIGLALPLLNQLIISKEPTATAADANQQGGTSQ